MRFVTQIIPINGEGGKFIIYRPLLGLAFIGNKGMARVALDIAEGKDTNIPAEVYEFLQNAGFFLPDPVRSPDTPFFSNAVLLLTNQCQLRCIYCYASAGEFAPLSLDVDSGKAVIDYVCKDVMEHGKREFEVAFHGGGEPTLVWNTLKELTEYVRQQPIPAKISITSNALWSKTQCLWLIKNIDSISVSMDGAPATQDYNRPLVSGKKSSSIVLRNLKLLDEHGFKYGIRMTVNRPFENLARNVEYIFQETQCRSIQAEPAFNVTRGAHASVAEDNEYSAFAQAFLDAYNVGKNYQATVRFSGARAGLVSDTFCSAPYHSMAVNPYNQIVTCYEVTNPGHPLAEISTFGRVEGGKVILDSNPRSRLHCLLAERQAQCNTCFCKWSCAGNCYTRSILPGENGHLIFGERCDMIRDLTQYLFLDMIGESGGVWSRSKSKLVDNFTYG